MERATKRKQAKTTRQTKKRAELIQSTRMAMQWCPRASRALTIMPFAAAPRSPPSPSRRLSPPSAMVLFLAAPLSLPSPSRRLSPPSAMVPFGCSSLASITLPPTLTSVAMCLSDCSSSPPSPPADFTSSAMVPFALLLSRFHHPPADSHLRRQWCLFGCSSLASITLPPTLTSVGEAAFRGCSSSLPSPFRRLSPPSAMCLWGCSSLAPSPSRRLSPPSAMMPLGLLLPRLHHPPADSHLRRRWCVS